MTNESDIPGLFKGMFFECYLFAPQTNFTEADLATLAKFIDIEFESEENIPETAKRHFKETLFEPKEDLTVSELADIFDSMNITFEDDSLLNRIPENIKEHLEDRTFKPFDDFGLEEMKDFLSKVVTFRLNPAQFETLSPHLKRQFIVYKRDGTTYRWGSRRPA